MMKQPLDSEGVGRGHPPQQRVHLYLRCLQINHRHGGFLKYRIDNHRLRGLNVEHHAQKRPHYWYKEELSGYKLYMAVGQ